MVKFAIGGVIGAILTPFLEHGDPDFGLLHAEVAALDRAGIDAVCVGGAVGEMAGTSTPRSRAQATDTAAIVPVWITRNSVQP